MLYSFKYLHQIAPNIETAFKDFYDKLLNDKQLAIFFDSHEQIEMLIEKQKKFFAKSLQISCQELELSYIKLGEYHYDIKIPYIDFMKGIDILEESFLIYSYKEMNSIELILEIFTYCKLIKAQTAKGYLNRMLDADEEDIEVFLSNLTTHEDDISREIVFDRIIWLRTLIHTIRAGEIFNFDNEEVIFKIWKDESNFVDSSKKVFIVDLEQRIISNAKNLFYFLEKGDFLEVLPLYTALLSIYKLTLLLSNSVSITMNECIVHNLKMDNLTNLYRKDAFEQFLEKEIEALKRNKSVFSVVFIDLDDFKYINDNYGHWSGDKVLEKVGECINANIRASDIGFRIGGDEFAIILKNAIKEEAYTIAKKIKNEIAKFEFLYNDMKSFHVDTSIGIHECNKADIMENIIKKVDEELYKSKNAGKGMISFA